jgi:Protein of unknown function (DUF2934)
MDQAIMFRVRERAYHIWAAQGGDAEKNWLQAESEIMQLTTIDTRIEVQKPKSRSHQRKAARRN